MANLLSNTTIGGYQSIHTGNIGSYALTSLPSHNHDDRYYTESESDSRFIRKNTWEGNAYIGTGGDIYGTIFYDSNDTTYYVDPSSYASRLKGLAVGENYYNHTYPGIVQSGSTNYNYNWGNGSWSGSVTLGYLANCSDQWEFGIHDSGHRVVSAFLFDGGGNNKIVMGRDLGWGATYIEAASSFRAPIFYDSADTSYYLDPNGGSYLYGLVLSGNSYFTPNNWIDVKATGIYSSTLNGAHFRPNSGSYGPWMVTGTRNGWSGIEFESLSNGNVSLMIQTTSNVSGWHNNSYGWQFQWSDGTAYVFKNSYGGGTKATVIDSSNYNSFSIPTKQYIWSRGENLLTNGTALLGNNTNFSSFTFDGSQAYSSSGSFKYTGQYGAPNTDELMPINAEKRYRLDFWAKTANGQGAYYAYLNFFDVDGNAIYATNHMYYPNTLTTLAQTLNPGDTVVYLTSAANWENGGTAGVATHIRSFIFWNYTNSFGYTYPPQTYSRNWYGGMWNPGGVNYSNNTITLISPWSGPSIPAGTQLSNGSAGGTFKYIALGYTIVPTTWTNYVGIMDGIDYSGSNAGGKFPPGTAAAKLGFLTDYNASGDTIYLANLFVGVDNDYPIYDRWTGSTRIEKSGAFYGTIFYDSDNGGYYLNPSSTSNLYTVNTVNTNISNAIYFGGGNNYLNWTNSRIYSNVGIESADSLRAPIFYDSNDTSYYVNPNGTSVLNYLTLNAAESMGVYGIRGKFTNEYIHLYNKVGVGNPNGWGEGQGNTPVYGLSTFGGLNVAYGYDGGATINTYTRINKNWGGGDYGAEAFTIRGTYPSITLRSTTHDSKWLIHHASNLQFYYGASADNNSWSNVFSITSNGNLYMAWAGTYISDLLDAKQNASTAINTSNIGSQSVSYATTAGSLSSMNISQFTNNSGYITSSALSSYLPLSGGTMSGSIAMGGNNITNVSQLAHANGRVILSGNLHIDSFNGYAIYLQYYNQGVTTRIYGDIDMNNYNTTNVNIGYANNSFRAPIFYDSQDTNYYVDPNGMSKQVQLTNLGTYGSNAANARNHFVQYNAGNAGIAGGWIAAAFGDATAARVVIGQAGSITEAIIGSHNGNLTDWGALGYVATTHKFYAPSWTSAVQLEVNTNGVYAPAYRGNANVGGTGTASWHPDGIYVGSTQWLYGTMYKNGSGIYDVGELTMIGGGTIPISITGASHKYLTINPGNGYEAMVRYVGGSGYSWYVGKRTSGQLVGTQSFHFYSEEAGATVGGITPGGIMYVTDRFETTRTNGTMFSHGSMSDAFGYNGNYGTYIGSPVGGTYYIYANGTFFDNGTIRSLIHSGNIGSQSVSYASSAGSVAWTNVSSRPTALSQFTNDLGNYGGWLTTGGKAADSELIDGIDSSRIVFGDGARASTYVSSMNDPNQKSGFFFKDSPTGQPFGDWWNWMTVAGNSWQSSNNYSFQIAHAFHSDDAYIRRMTNGTAYSWRTLITSGNIGSQSVNYANSAGSASSATTATVASQLNKYGDIYGQDWNSYYIQDKLIAAAVYGHSGANRPVTTYDYGVALSYGEASGPVMQMYFPENSPNIGTIFRKAHYRTGWNGNWSTWKTIVEQEGNTCTIVGGNQTGIEIHANVGYNQDPLTYFLLRGQADTSWKALKIRLTGDAGGQNIEFRRIAENGADDRMFYVPRSANQVIFDYQFVQGSDSRLKDNITPITNSLDKVKSLRGVEFDWNSGVNEGTHDVGLIAQEVEAVLPEAVTTQEDGYKNLAYTKVIPLLVEAMKEQQAMIDALKAEIELLKNK